MAEREIELTGVRILLRPATLEEIIDLRHALLRAGLPCETAIFPGDDAPTTRHLAAFADGGAIACVTLHASEVDQKPAWQLRGMAVNSHWQGRGLGRQLLAFLDVTLAEDGDRHPMWCNAREPAIGFYQGLGWHVISEPFDVPTAGPHVRMAKRQ